jgi:conjugal transfer pilus assembly protein TraW
VHSSDLVRPTHAAQRRLAPLAAVVFAALAAAATTPACAQDLGVIGPVYAIAEPSLLEMILGKLRAAGEDGTLARLQRESLARVRRGVEDPVPVTGLARTRHPRHFLHDPSIVVSEAIRDADGRVSVPPGTVVNALDTVSLSQALLFIDARDGEQVARARKLIDERQGKVKVILTGGSYLELMRRWQRPVFYDQQGSLSTKLGIRQVPALVTQDGRRLRIDELL